MRRENTTSTIKWDIGTLRDPIQKSALYKQSTETIEQ